MTEEGDSYKLEVIDCQNEDAGEYKVAIKNILGEDTDSATLGIIRKHDFTT